MRNHDSKAGFAIIIFSTIILVGIIFLIAQKSSVSKEGLEEQKWLQNTAAELEKKILEIKSLENQAADLSYKLESKISRKEREGLRKNLAEIESGLNTARTSFETLATEYSERFHKLENGGLKKDLPAPEKFEFKK